MQKGRVNLDTKPKMENTEEGQMRKQTKVIITQWISTELEGAPRGDTKSTPRGPSFRRLAKTPTHYVNNK
jgi:hypothetical protein